MHQRDPVAAVRFIHKVSGDKDCHLIPAGEFNDQFPEKIPCNRVHSGSRFVKDQDFRTMDHRCGERKSLFQPQWQIFGKSMFDLLQLEPVEHFFHPHRNFVFRDPVEAGIKFQVLSDRKLTVKREELSHISQLLPDFHGVFANGFSEQLRTALCCRKQPCEHPHGRRLSASVGTEESEDLAFPDLETDMVHGGK